MHVGKKYIFVICNIVFKTKTEKIQAYQGW